MPPARHTSAARIARETGSFAREAGSFAREAGPSVREAGGSRAHAQPAPRQVARRLPRSRIGWDRKFRAIMLISLALIGWIGVKAGVALLSARSQSSQEAGLIGSLRAERQSLLARQHALHQRATIMRDARQLGMVRAGERSYVVVGQ